MDIDIRGIWRYKAMRETCEGLRDAIAAKEACIAAQNDVIEKQKQEIRRLEDIRKVLFDVVESRDMTIKQKDCEAETAKATICQLREERDNAKKTTEGAIERFFCEKEKLKKKHAEEVKSLEAEAEEQHHSYESLEEYCKMIESDAKKLKEKIEELEAENAKLKKTRYRWVDSRHGWWPVESADLDDLVMKVPYVVYTMQKREQESQEEQEKKRIPEV